MVRPDILVWHLLSRKVDVLDELHSLQLNKGAIATQQYEDEELRLLEGVYRLNIHLKNVNDLAKFIGNTDERDPIYLKLDV